VNGIHQESCSVQCAHRNQRRGAFLTILRELVTPVRLVVGMTRLPLLATIAL
jgi:hypothetical protein